MQKNYKKELLLKGNSVKRLVKEYQCYDKEVLKLQNKINELKNDNVEEYIINKQVDSLGDSEKVREKVKQSLQSFTDELNNLINEIDDEDVKNLEEYKNAVLHLESSNELMKSF